MSSKYKNEKRSPLKSASLRHAGQSLDEKIYDVFISKALFPAVVFFVFFVLAIFEWLGEYFSSFNHPWYYTTTAVIAFVYFLIRIRKFEEEVKNLKLGRDGECIVAEALEGLRVMGYKVYNDIVGESFNIDHILVGPAGVFTIETKTYRKQIGANSQIYYDGDNIKIDGLPNNNQMKDPIKQAKGQMYWLEGFINNNAKIRVKVKPVVVFPGWFINQKNSNVEVLVLNETVLPNVLKNSPRVLNPEQINLIATHLESYIRSN